VAGFCSNDHHSECILNIGNSRWVVSVHSARPAAPRPSRPPVQPRPRRLSDAAVLAPSDVCSGRAPPVSAVWRAAVTRERSGRTWRGYRGRSECEATADSDRRGTGVCRHRSRSAATTIPTRPATAIARIRSAKQSAANWNQPAIAQPTAGRRWRIANRRCPTRVTVGQSCRSIEHRHFGGVALACSAGSGLLRFLNLRRADHGVRCISGLAGHLPPP